MAAPDPQPMKRPSRLRLALMGGGLVLTVGAGATLLAPDSAACRQARAENSPDVDRLCNRISSRGGGSSVGYGGSRSSSGDGGIGASSASSSVSRGGFGGAGASAHAGS